MNVEHERGVILPFVLVVCLLITLLMQGILTLLQREPHLIHTERLSMYQKAQIQQAIDEGWQRLEQSSMPLYKKIEQSRTDTSAFSHLPLQHVLDNRSVEISAPYFRSDGVFNIPASELSYWPEDAWCRMQIATDEKKWHCTRFEISAHMSHAGEPPSSEVPAVWRNQMARLIHARKLKTGHLSIVQGGVELARTGVDDKVEKVLIPLYWRLSTAG